MKKDNITTLLQLGDHGKGYQYDSPDKSLLETFPNQFPERDYLTQFIFNEFTSLCVSGDTRIDVARDETLYPDGIPIKNLVGKEGVVFCFDVKTGIPIARQFHSVRKTRSNARVVKIILEVLSADGKGNITKTKKEIKVTPEHLILVSTGWHKFSWIRADKLKHGMRLIADQKSQDTIRGKARHRLIMENELGRFLEEGELVHHKDLQHYNNTPENLEVTVQADHFSYHQTIKYGYEEKLPSIEELVNMYNSGQYNFFSLAKKFNCDTSTIESRIGHLVNRRTQSESLLIKREFPELQEKVKECRALYEKGYTTYELAEFYVVHNTTIRQWIIIAGGKLRTTLETKVLRRNLALSSLNHKVIQVVDAGFEDVYNMEVEEVENYFAEDVVLHNCPKTHQPDFATITLEYIADKLCIETKSLKIYYLAFRNEGAFMETITNTILEDCWAVAQPKWMKVTANFNARGGTLINVIAEQKR